MVEVVLLALLFAGWLAAVIGYGIWLDHAEEDRKDREMAEERGWTLRQVDDYLIAIGARKYRHHG